jgi:hypothetical protein
MPAGFESVLRQNLFRFCLRGLFLSDSIMAFSRGEASKGRWDATFGQFLSARNDGHQRRVAITGFYAAGG